MWPVAYIDSARQELLELPATEQAAMLSAVEKLAALGPQLRFPRTSAVRGSPGLRELRPRAGRSAWRALYQQVGDALVIAAIAPEAVVDKRGFERACRSAASRLDEIRRG